MKRKKIIVFILIFLIIVLSICSISIRFIDKKEERLIGIVDYEIYKNKEIIEIVDDLYLIRNSKGIIEVVDKKGEMIVTLGEDVIEVGKVSDGYLVYCNDGTYLIDSNKTVRKKFSYRVLEMVDRIGRNSYYYEIDGTRCIVYDNSFNVILEVDGDNGFSVLAIVDNKLYGSNKKIYDVKTGIEVGSYENIYELGDSYYLVDGVDKKLVNCESRLSYNVNSYYKKNDVYVVSTINDVYVISEKGERRDNVSTYKLDNGYYMDASTCDNGYILKDKDGKEVYSDCVLSYDISFIDNNVLVIGNLNGKKVYVVNNVISREYDDIVFVGDYILVRDGSYYLFDMDGFKVIEEDFWDFQFIGNGQYLMQTNNGVMVLDNSLKVINEYSSMVCDKGICAYEKDNRYGLYYNGKEQTNNEFYNIVCKDNRCIVKDIAFDAVIDLDYEKSDKSFLELFELKYGYYEEIEINDIVERYHLESKHSIIFEDEILFKKYAYVIENNDKLEGYRNIFYEFYRAVVGEKEYLDENNFLYALKELKVVESDVVSVLGAAGVYNDASKKIEFLKGSITPSVYFHELFHFLDYNINYSNGIYDYICSGQIVSKQEYKSYDNKGSCQVFNVPYTQFITEAGAEIYSVHYFIPNEMVRAYQWGTYIYEMLNYLLGNKVMEKIYYSPDTTYDFYKLMVKGYNMPYEDYNEMVTVFNRLTKIETMYDDSVMEKAKNWLVYLYNMKNPNSDWKNDTEFAYYIKYGHGRDIFNLGNSLHSINANMMIEIYGMRKGYNIKDIHVRENGTYIYFEILDYNYSIIDNIRVLYDFKNNKMIEYKKIEGV